MFNSMLGAFSAEMAIDPGTAMTRILVAGQGVVCAVPSVVAIHEDRDGFRRVLAVGDEARDMEGRTPPDIRTVRPVVEGVIQDFEMLEAMLRTLIMQVQGRRLWVGPRIALAIPYGTTDVERRAVRESVEATGAREVVLAEKPLAAALGAGLPVDDACGQMVVDVGAGSSTLSVVSLGGIVQCRTLPVGGNAMDEAIRRHVRDQHGVTISRSMAEAVRQAVGSAMPGGPTEFVSVRGRHLESGWPRAVDLDSNEVRIALQTPVHRLGEAVLATLERTPPDLAADVASMGIVMVGGAARLPGLARALSTTAGLPVVVPDEPEHAVVSGAIGLMEQPAARVIAS
ncbi:MAG: rod shape-determining protein [Myxococcota bacterium]|nr:rod shape-determining protein [Myxococcota bacterium]